MRGLLFGLESRRSMREGYLLFSQRKCGMLPVGNQNGSF
jgi:hypothetical protein